VGARARQRIRERFSQPAVADELIGRLKQLEPKLLARRERRRQTRQARRAAMDREAGLENLYIPSELNEDAK